MIDACGRGARQQPTHSLHHVGSFGAAPLLLEEPVREVGSVGHELSNQVCAVDDASRVHCAGHHPRRGDSSLAQLMAGAGLTKRSVGSDTDVPVPQERARDQSPAVIVTYHPAALRRGHDRDRTPSL